MYGIQAENLSGYSADNSIQTTESRQLNLDNANNWIQTTQSRQSFNQMCLVRKHDILQSDVSKHICANKVETNWFGY